MRAPPQTARLNRLRVTMSQVEMMDALWFLLLAAAIFGLLVLAVLLFTVIR